MFGAGGGSGGGGGRGFHSSTSQLNLPFSAQGLTLHRSTTHLNLSRICQFNH